MAFITFIAHYPEAGAIIPGSGGVRKVRWPRRGAGKRGGVRVIYYFHGEAMPLFLLTVYAKSRRTDLSESEFRIMRRLVAQLKVQYAKE
jgi:hypothetical protein